jgi:hypothetical protein
MLLRNPLRPRIKKHQHRRDTITIPVITITIIISTTVVVIVSVEVIVIITTRVTVNTVHHADTIERMMRVRQLEVEVEVERGKNRGSPERTVGIGHKRDEKKSNAMVGLVKSAWWKCKSFTKGILTRDASKTESETCPSGRTN